MKAAEAAAIRQFLTDLGQQYWMRGKRWWPKCAFHFTEVSNAATILNEGELLARAQLSDDQFHDGANPEVIRDTRTEAKQYVRLYFGPRTPTQFNTEGIRPPDQRDSSGAHIPRPVYFMFSLPDLAVSDECFFSNGSMRYPDTTVGQGIDFLRSLDFKKIYHRRGFSPADRDEIVNARHSEVLFRDTLDLTNLYAVVCRTVAERESLLYLMDDGTRRRYRGKILVRPDLNLFERRWVFIDSVQWIKPGMMRFKFFGSSETPGPFEVAVRVHTEDRHLGWDDAERYFRPGDDQFALRLPDGVSVDPVEVEVRLDDCTAYRNRIEYISLVD